MPGPALSQWGHLHQSGPTFALSLPLSGRLLGRELWTRPRGTDTQAEYGGSCRHTSLSAHHFEYVLLSLVITQGSCHSTTNKQKICANTIFSSQVLLKQILKYFGYHFTHLELFFTKFQLLMIVPTKWSNNLLRDFCF